MNQDKTTPSDSCILVIGGGIGGLALALALQRRHIPVAVFERASDLGEVGAGVMLTPNATRALEHLGILGDVETHATVPGVTKVRHFQTGEVLSTMDLGETFTQQHGHRYYCVHRVDIHNALLRAVMSNDPQCVHTSHDFSDYIVIDSGVQAHFRNGMAVNGRLLVGCDGVRSVVRRKIGFQDGAKFTNNIAWRGLIPVEDLPAHQRGPEITIWSGPKRHVVEYTIRNGRIKNYVAIANSPAWEDEGWSKRSNVAAALNEFEDWHPDVRAIITATPPETGYVWGLFDRDPLDYWSKGSLTLLGDAAHPMLPFLAQGAAMAIEDAVVLARCLASSSEVPEALGNYERLRRERTAWCQLQAREAGHLFQRISKKSELDGDRAERARRLYGYAAQTVAL